MKSEVTTHSCGNARAVLLNLTFEEEFQEVEWLKHVQFVSMHDYSSIHSASNDNPKFVSSETLDC